VIFFLAERLESRDLILSYDLSAGVRGVDGKTSEDYTRFLVGYDVHFKTEFEKIRPRNPAIALQLIENYVRTRSSEGKSIAVIVQSVETLAPMGQNSELTPADGFQLLTLIRLVQDPQLRKNGVTFVYVAANRSDVNERLATDPSLVPVEVPATDRGRFMTVDELYEKIREAVEGLKFYSESVYGARAWRPGKRADDLRMTSDEFAKFIGVEADKPYEFDHSGFSGFMGRHCDDERIAALVALMDANLEQLRVFRAGAGTLTCYVYGRHRGGEVLGFMTTLAET
jgi:hypothetical protein